MRVLVTGGGGFLGRAIAQRLFAQGMQVRTLQRSAAPELADLGVECVRGDIGDANSVNQAVANCQMVFHVAPKAGVWGDYNEYHRINVTGTENIINACREHRVARLIYTSSPSVVFNGQDEQGIDEAAPYPSRYLTHYPRTKAMAEQRVVAANGDSLATVALRPHLIWGPGDNHLFPRLVQRGRAGELRRVGNGKNLVDATYIDNAAEAHLLAADALKPGSAVAGKVYFISNGEPLPLWDLIDKLLACAQVPPVTRTVSATAAYAAGAAMELLYKLTGRQDEPRMTRFVARQLATSHWFRLDAARRDFGYVPLIAVEEGLKRLADSLSETR